MRYETYLKRRIFVHQQSYHHERIFFLESVYLQTAQRMFPASVDLLLMLTRKFKKLYETNRLWYLYLFSNTKKLLFSRLLIIFIYPVRRLRWLLMKQKMCIVICYRTSDPVMCVISICDGGGCTGRQLGLQMIFFAFCFLGRRRLISQTR